MKIWRVVGIVAAGVLCACNSGQDARTLRGQIELTSYSLPAPTVLVESGNHLSYTTTVSKTGSFAIAVPAGQRYRVTLANQNADGTLALVSRVLWTRGGATFVWANVGSGAVVSFGTIRPLTAVAASGSGVRMQSDDQGENDDDQGECDDNDDSQGDEQGEADAGGTCHVKMQSPCNPSLCMPAATMGKDSEGDQDEGCDQDDDQQGDDDRDGNGSGVCGDGGVMSGDDHNQGDDNAQGNEDEDDNGGGKCMKHLPPCGAGAPDMGSGGAASTPDMSGPVI
jgi:hypothetical protein